MAGRAAFGPDGTIYLTVNDHVEHDGRDNGNEPLLAQQLDNDVGKVLRIRDDGGIPADNPFVGREGANAQVFTYGQRNVTDFAWHPETGELWTTEIAPMGGDEINILRAGQNYGWPLVSLGKNYNRKELSDNHWYLPGMEMPAMYWTPSISPSTLTWYTGDKLAPWKGQLFVGALNGQTLQRVAFDQPMPQAERRDSLFHVAGPALASRRSGTGRLSLCADGEAHARRPTGAERHHERRRLPHRTGRLTSAVRGERARSGGGEAVVRGPFVVRGWGWGGAVVWEGWGGGGGDYFERE